ncbi:MAG: hypothetical protein ACO1RX_03665 [Candidatus Sericytochromatia bacterium]
MPQNHEDPPLSEVLAQSALQPLDPLMLEPDLEQASESAETDAAHPHLADAVSELEARIVAAQDPDSLQELIGQALRLEREDLVAAILDKSIRLNRLIEKLQDFELQPGPQTISLFGDDDE